jgi:hypothetical protein
MAPRTRRDSPIDTAAPRIESRIVLVRGQRVMIDADLAAIRRLMAPPEPGPKRKIGFV